MANFHEDFGLGRYVLFQAVFWTYFIYFPTGSASTFSSHFIVSTPSEARRERLYENFFRFLYEIKELFRYIGGKNISWCSFVKFWITTLIFLSGFTSIASRSDVSGKSSSSSTALNNSLKVYRFWTNVSLSSGWWRLPQLSESTFSGLQPLP